MKITDLIISGILKRGILYEAKKVDVEFDIPKSKIEGSEGNPDDKIKIKFTAENMTLRIEKE